MTGEPAPTRSAGGQRRGGELLRWAATFAAIIAGAVVVALIVGLGSNRTVTTTRTTPAPLAPAPPPASATVPFTLASPMRGARGSVIVTATGGGKLRLMIGIAMNQRYGVALWSSRRHWRGLYVGAAGANLQTLEMEPQQLSQYRWLEAVQALVRGRVSRGFIVGASLTPIAYHHILRVPTGELLRKLVAAAAR